jgi:hypothetical protein
MSVETKIPSPSKNKLLSIDSWAVLLAFVAALLIRTGVFKHVPW